MRLTCPNCGAQYEVPDEVIPADGRDVQCSNCGDTWFQKHPDTILQEERDLEDAQLVDEDAPSDAPEDIAEDEPEDDYDDVEFEEIPGAEDMSEDGEDNEPEFQEVPRIDPSVSEILRQEAEHEARLRAAEQGEPLESQSDLGIDGLPSDEAEKRSREARERMAKIRGEPTETDTADHGSRRGLLPDIDEINSTLRATGEAPAATAAMDVVEPRKRGGFLRGFGLIVLLAVIALLLYVNAPKISAALPAAEPVLTSYVALVDQARVWLDGLVGGFIPK